LEELTYYTPISPSADLFTDNYKNIEWDDHLAKLELENSKEE
jgi:hypothetical protein